jgi:hypothetical protein
MHGYYQCFVVWFCVCMFVMLGERVPKWLGASRLELWISPRKSYEIFRLCFILVIFMNRFLEVEYAWICVGYSVRPRENSYWWVISCIVYCYVMFVSCVMASIHDKLWACIYLWCGVSVYSLWVLPLKGLVTFERVILKCFNPW